MSETAAARHILQRFCEEPILDLGYGGSAITLTSINIDQPSQYTTVGTDPCHIRGDARHLFWFKDGVISTVYSSHLLEDFPPHETMSIVTEWLRVLRSGGRLILLLPDEPVYRRHCESTGQDYNRAHQNHVLTLEWFKNNIVFDLPSVKIEFEQFPINIYSFAIVLRKL